LKLALLTQRVDVHPDYGERRDALDQRWAAFLEQAGYAMCAVPNHSDLDAPGYLDRLSPDLIVLTGGNSIAMDGVPPGQIAQERDALENKLIAEAMKRDIAIKGICRGMQMLNVHFGGSLRPVANHVAVTHPIHGSREAEVNSYHDFGIAEEDLAEGLEATAWARDGTIEAFRVANRRIDAIMWHPEREGEFHPADIAWIRGDT
tara:strand:- start:2466 stop:3077 length:612 start_codon:yes stop_codon:yes gene_type:complete